MTRFDYKTAENVLFYNHLKTAQKEEDTPMAKKISQLKLPSPNDTDPHPRLLLDGYGIHAGECFQALFPDGWHDITLEVGWNETGPACW